MSDFNKDYKDLTEALENLAQKGLKAYNAFDRLKKELNIKEQRCEHCVWYSKYRDMGSTTPTCGRGGLDFCTAVKEIEKTEPCEYKFTYKDVEIATAIKKSNLGKELWNKENNND